ncbi:hypothetical protein HanPI659440_Chr04g0175031 [Helianthus annuus]|nr:hypothetical protein HanPI659440_Chr04g0175031 [Helianthus annuus]
MENNHLKIPDSLKNDVMQVALDYSEKVYISTWIVRHCKDDKEYASVMARPLEMSIELLILAIHIMDSINCSINLKNFQLLSRK